MLHAIPVAERAAYLAASGHMATIVTRGGEGKDTPSLQSLRAAPSPLKFSGVAMSGPGVSVLPLP